MLEAEEAGERRVIADELDSGEDATVRRRKKKKCYDTRGVRKRLESVFLASRRCDGDWVRKCGQKRMEGWW